MAALDATLQDANHQMRWLGMATLAGSSEPSERALRSLPME